MTKSWTRFLVCYEPAGRGDLLHPKRKLVGVVFREFDGYPGAEVEGLDLIDFFKSQRATMTF